MVSDYDSEKFEEWMYHEFPYSYSQSSGKLIRMKATDSSSVHAGFFSLMLEHPAVQEDIAGFATLILHQALSVSEISDQVIASISATEIAEFVGANAPAREEVLPNEERVLGRRQITARDAAMILCYNPRYFSRKAKDWGLTKIRMSRTSCRYYLDEVEQLAVERGVRKPA